MSGDGWGLFLAVSWGGLRFVIVVFSDHTHSFCFQSTTFEGIEQFHSHLTEGLSIIKYWSVLNLKVICKRLIELCPFFT